MFARRKRIRILAPLVTVVAVYVVTSGSACGEGTADCHPAYESCLPNLEGDAIDCSDIDDSLKPVRVKQPGIDPYWLDADRNGVGCEVQAEKVGEFLENLFD